ncbi:hypothetical protein F5Y06DRAFT_44505 [Hypoxylon sp. FL0890]|nr:hypothetical protein F5Y06DRAFT_44505 [Hypoxylon sp. FL0890]
MTLSKTPCNLWLLYCWRFLLPAIVLSTSFCVLWNWWPVPRLQNSLQDAHRNSDVDASHVDSNHVDSLPNHDRNITVNLVVATLSNDDISWTENLGIPNLNVIRYVSDDMEAPYHPPVPYKGREALIYHAYMHDFYDDLPDITIFTHADETPWHMESILNSSMTFALSHLDLNEVLERQYFNLRVSWENACPNWINTTKTVADSGKLEEKHMHEAFSKVFPDNQVPEILAGPCCSQFAVTRDAVRRNPRSQYQINMDWLIETELDDYISGRVWEHMWPWLFKGEAVDCDVEWKAYCKMYHICFNPESRVRLTNLEEEKKYLQQKNGLLEEFLDLLGGYRDKKRLDEINAIIAAEVENALETGKTQERRMELLGDAYSS